MERPICKSCKKNACVINYQKNGKYHYRSLCRKCIANKKLKKDLANQLLVKSGYVKKKICDRCGFKSKHPSQIKLIYLDGDRLNVSRANLRSYCLNCDAEINFLPQSKQSDLVPDY